MGLLTILRKIKQREKEIRILVLGLDNAGKTSVVRRLNGDDVTKVAPTLGFSIIPMQFGEFALNIWDVGGQKTIRTFWRNYFEQTDGILWVVDSADRDRLLASREELSAVLQEERLSGATLLILANKQDLPGALSPEQVADQLQLSTVGTVTRHWRVEGCSAFQGGEADAVDGTLRRGMEWFIDDITSRIFIHD